MINQFAVLAKPASGKTTAIAEIILPRLQKLGYRSISISDRPILNNLVFQDAAEGSKDDDGWHHGTHSWIKFDDEGNPVLKAMSGRHWNEAHRMMVQQMNEIPDRNTIAVYEFGIGPRVHFPTETLFQEAADIFSLMHTEGVTQNIAVIEIDTPFDIRLANNGQRPMAERMDKKTFTDYFPDGGEGNVGLALSFNICNYIKFQNNIRDPNWFDTNIHNIIDSFVQPLIEGRNLDPMRRR